MVPPTSCLQVFTDELFASGIDLTMKSHAKLLQNSNRNAFMYKFDYRSTKENPNTYWMGR